MTIPFDQYELVEATILSGQVAQEDVPALLDGDPAFARWYRERAEQRRQRKQP